MIPVADVSGLSRLVRDFNSFALNYIMERQCLYAGRPYDSEGLSP